MQLPRIIVCLMLSFALLPVVAGCGGGASEETTVKIKRDTGDSAGGNGDEAGGGPAGGAAAPEGKGTLKGKVVLQGGAPDLPLLIRAGASIKDAEVCAAKDLPNERLVVSPDGGVANVFIYLRKAPPGAEVPPPPEEEAVFDQKNCRFLPHVFLVRTAQPVTIKNSDPILHNTHTYPGRNNGFNASIKSNGAESTVYDRAEAKPFEVKCDIHAWMIAYHLPLDHPYAAVTNENGEFEIPDVPSGDHRFQIWHEGAVGGFLSRGYSVTINPDEVTEVTIDYPLDKFDQ